MAKLSIENKEYKSGIMEVNEYFYDSNTQKETKKTSKKIVQVILNPSRETVNGVNGKFYYHIKTKDIYWWKNEPENRDHYDVWDTFFNGDFGYSWDEQFYKGLFDFTFDNWGEIIISKHGPLRRDPKIGLVQDLIDLPEVVKEVREFYNIKKEKKWRQ